MYLMSLFILKDVAEGLEGTVTDTLKVGLVVSNAPNAPRYASFMADGDWNENPACRHWAAGI